MNILDPETIARWRALGLSDAEIGRRLGVSADRLRALTRAKSPTVPDDDGPNRAGVR